MLWFKSARRNVTLLFVVSIIVNIGMWLERYVIVITSLHRDFLPSSWGMFNATFWDWSTYIGTIGLFLTLLFLFVRVMPVISIFEMRELVEEHGSDHAVTATTSSTTESADTGSAGSASTDTASSDGSSTPPASGEESP